MIPCEGDVPASRPASCANFALKAAAIAVDGSEISRLMAFEMGLEEMMNVG